MYGENALFDPSSSCAMGAVESGRRLVAVDSDLMGSRAEFGIAGVEPSYRHATEVGRQILDEAAI